MALQLDDPLSQSIYGLGLQQTQPWDPTQEAARKDKTWGQTQQKVGERYSRAGLTGSSQELGDLANTAKNFELDWGERGQKQRADALSSVLPIQNFRRGVANDAANTTLNTGRLALDTTRMGLDEAYRNRMLGNSEDASQEALWGNLLASSGLPSWLASTLFGTSNPAGGGSSAGGLVPQGMSALYKLLSGGGFNPQAGNYSVDQLNTMDPAIDWNSVGDWWNQNYLTDTSFNADVPSWLGDLTGYW